SVALFPFTLISAYYFFITAAATTDIYTLSLHDALPISPANTPIRIRFERVAAAAARDGADESLVITRPWPRSFRHVVARQHHGEDRKSTRLNSSHLVISYAVFCLKKKTQKSKRSKQLIV